MPVRPRCEHDNHHDLATAASAVSDDGVPFDACAIRAGCEARDVGPARR